MKADSRSTTSNKSVINKLTHDNKINNRLLVLINNLTLEDLIAIKLELAIKQVNNRLYGFDIWRRSGYIIREALLKFAISATQSKMDAARFLGVNYLEFKKLIKKYELEDHFNNENLI